MHHIDHEQLMLCLLCISHGYCTSLQRDRYCIYPIDIDIYNIDINIASTAGPPQGHRGGGGVHNTPTSNTEANNPTDPGNTTTQHHRATGGGGGVYPPYTMRGGGWGWRPCTISIYILFIKMTRKVKVIEQALNMREKKTRGVGEELLPLLQVHRGPIKREKIESIPSHLAGNCDAVVSGFQS